MFIQLYPCTIHFKNLNLKLKKHHLIINFRTNVLYVQYCWNSRGFTNHQVTHHIWETIQIFQGCWDLVQRPSKGAEWGIWKSHTCHRIYRVDFLICITKCSILCLANKFIILNCIQSLLCYSLWFSACCHLRVLFQFIRLLFNLESFLLQAVKISFYGLEFMTQLQVLKADNHKFNGYFSQFIFQFNIPAN